MVARLREKTETAVIRSPSASRKSSGETPMMAQHLDSRALDEHDRQPIDRRLRNRIIAGNVIAWFAIIILIRLVF